MRVEDAPSFVEGFIDSWLQNPEIRHLAKALKKKRKELVEQVEQIFRQTGLKSSQKADMARALLYRRLPSDARFDLKREHFVLFKKAQLVELVLEGAFGLQLGTDSDTPLFPYQEEVVRIIARCIFPLKDRDVVTFLALFSGRKEDREKIDQEKSMRYRSMLWFAYLVLDMIHADHENICKSDIGYFRRKLKVLLEKVINGELIDPRSRSEKFDYEGGKWNDTLFGWLQGEENRKFVEKLRRQFNLDNRVEHGNRILLAKHRECIYKQALDIFCE